jgi:hypothetical protein
MQNSSESQEAERRRGSKYLPLEDQNPNAGFTGSVFFLFFRRESFPEFGHF